MQWEPSPEPSPWIWEQQQPQREKLELEAVARYTGERAAEEMDQRTCSDTMMN